MGRKKWNQQDGGQKNRDNTSGMREIGVKWDRKNGEVDPAVGGANGGGGRNYGRGVGWLGK